MEVAAPGTIGAGIRYQPQRRYPALFRIFADTNPTQDSIAEFAGTYGCLGGRVSKFIVLDETKDDGAGGRPMESGETYAGWCWEIFRMRSTVELWEMVRRRDERGLRQRIVWDGSKLVAYQSRPRLVPVAGRPVARGKPGDLSALIASAKPGNTTRPELLERFPQGDLYGPALAYLQQTVNDAIKAQVSPRLLFDADGRLGAYQAPSNLLGLLWWQCMQAIGGDADFERCRHCATWFPIGGAAGRRGKKFCSAACRTAAYRRRKEANS